MNGYEPRFNEFLISCLGTLVITLDKDNFNEARGIDESEARLMVKKLAKHEGIFAGTSTGLNLVGALQLAKEIGKGRNVVTLACDSGFKYLNGNLFS